MSTSNPATTATVAVSSSSSSSSLTSVNAEEKKEKKYEFYAGMTCDGCKNAINKILSSTPGVSKVEADVDKKQLIVTANISNEVIMEKLAKWSKASKKEVKFIKQIS